VHDVIVQEAGATDRRTLKRLLVIVAAAFAIRASYVIAVTRHDPHVTDALWYTWQAISIGHGKGIVIPLVTPPHPSAYHAPLTSIILAPVARLTHGDETVMRLTMAFVGCVVVLTIALIARELAGDRGRLDRRSCGIDLPEPLGQ
jgi:4-amino-4-deoxy-L-arabinose transferase-like glycosyltransferase